MSIVNGSDLMVFVGGKSIAYATSHSLSISADTTSTSSKTKDDVTGAWQTAKVTAFSWSVSAESLFSIDTTAGKTYEELFTAMTSGTAVTISFAIKTDATTVPSGGWTPSSATGDIVLTGSAFITSLSLSAPDDENASFSVEFAGTGELTNATA